MDHIFFSSAARPLYLWNMSWNVLISDAEQKDKDASLALTLKEIVFSTHSDVSLRWNGISKTMYDYL